MTPESCPSVFPNARSPRGWPCRDTGLFMATLGRVIFVHIDERLTPQAFDRYLYELERSIDLRTAGYFVGVVYDVPELTLIDALRRRKIAELLQSREQRLAMTTVGVAVATPSKVARGVLEAIFWMAPPGYAHVAVNNVREALAFLQQYLPEVDPETYEFEYRRMLGRYGVLTSSPPMLTLLPGGRPKTAPPMNRP